MLNTEQSRKELELKFQSLWNSADDPQQRSRAVGLLLCSTPTAELLEIVRRFETGETHDPSC